MSTGNTPASSARTRVPFDLPASEREDGWRDSLHWPIAPSEERAAFLEIAERLLQLVRELGDHDTRDVAIVAAQDILTTTTTLAHAALAVERAEQCGIVLAGGPPEVSFLADGTSDGNMETSVHRHSPGRARFPALRQIARTASWTPLRRLSRALLNSDVTAITHNTLLRAYARRDGLAVRFWQAEQMLDAARLPASAVIDDCVTNLATRVVDAVLLGLPLEESRRARLALLLLQRVAVSLAKAQVELLAVSAWRGLPREIWLGSAGQMPSRTIAVAARRRGARVTSFGHGGGLFRGHLYAGTILRELAVVDRIVVATEADALACPRLPDGPPTEVREVLWADGDPTFRRIRPAKPPRTNARRILYLPCTLRGFRTLIPPLLPDVVALDWQMRLAQMLLRLPVELAVRPHPESLLPGRRHPATQACTPLVDQPFFRTVDMVDAFVFEYPNSTAFWEALCTDRPVVWIDLGTGNLTEETRAVVDRRCRIVEASFDSRNRPQLGEAVLADAVCGAPHTADPTEIRRLLAGDRS